MTTRQMIPGVVCALVIMNLAQGQELGRGPLATGSGEAGLGRAPLPATHYDGYALAGTWGVKPSLGWGYVHWSVGSADGSEFCLVPQASFFYKATDYLDINLSALYASAEDTDSQLGKTKADLTRLALGARYWINTRTRLTPYLGGGLGYYLLSGSTKGVDDDVKNAPGAFLEGGTAFQVTDNFFVNLDLTYDFLLGSADATINGKDEKFNVQALALNLGVTWMF